MDDRFGLPMSFGKVSAKYDAAHQIAQTKRSADEDAKTKTKGKEKEQEAEHRKEDEEDADPSEDPHATVDPPLPVSHQVVMSDHSKTVAALSLDPSGARLVSGAYDYSCKLWDFGGMNASFKPFHTWQPREGHQVHHALWSNTGHSFLVITAANQPQLYDRDGLPIAEYIKGDMYIRDMRHCAGHIAELTGAAWHPKNLNTFITSAADSTVRIWDVEDKRKSKSVIVLKSKERGTRTKITACAYSSDGRSIAATGMDGTLNVWSASSNFARPNSQVESAHAKNSETSSISFSADNSTLLTRGGDHSVKLWDLRSMKKPLVSREELPNLNPETNAIFSPDERYVLTGLPGDKALNKQGSLIILNRSDLSTYQAISISPANVVRVLWHSRINQIFTGSSDGSIHVLYSPNISVRGATLALSHAPKVRGPDETDPVSLDRPIITPHALPMYRDDIMNGGTAAGGRGGKRKRERERQDPIKTQKPMPPLTGPGKGGRVGASATQHVVQGLVKDSIRHEDPREALLRFAEEHAGEKPKFTAAWEVTNPKPIFDESLLEEETKREKEREEKEEERKRLKREKPKPL